MSDYKFEISNLSFKKNTLNISASVSCLYDEKVLSPKIRLLFERDGVTRRLPMPVDEYFSKDGMAVIKGSYSYSVGDLFSDKSNGGIRVSFDFFYGEDEINSAELDIGCDIPNCFTCDNNSISIISYENISRMSAFDSMSRVKKIKKLLRTPLIWLINIYYKFLCSKSVVPNRVTFMSGRRDELDSNQLFIYNQIKDNDDIDFKFLMFSNAKGHFDIKNLISFLKLYSSSAVVVVDDYFRLLNLVDKRDDVKLIQVWHACGAFKTFGFSRLGKNNGPRQNEKNHRMYDYAVVSSNDVVKHYAEGFGIDDKKVLPLGVARTDMFFDSDYADKVRSSFYKKYPHLKDKKIILFAPTFRGSGQMSAYYPVDKLDLQALYDELDGEYAIILKLHPFCKNSYILDENYKNCIIDLSSDDELNDLLFVTDLLITDYSSAVFEASLLDIPMLFYSFDLKEYVSDRDFYYEYESFVPGKIVFSQAQLKDAVLQKDFEQYKTEEFRRRFLDGSDGNASLRVGDLIIGIIRGEI